MSSFHSALIAQLNNDLAADFNDSIKERNAIKIDPNGNMIQNGSMSSFASSSSFDEDGTSSNSESKTDDNEDFENDDVLNIKTR